MRAFEKSQDKIFYSLAVVGTTVTARDSPWDVKPVTTPVCAPSPWTALISPLGAKILICIPVVLALTVVALSTILSKYFAPKQ